ncbi:MAG: hypothetical protein ACTSVI_14205 [Promethearchaeota archaeon]
MNEKKIKKFSLEIYDFPSLDKLPERVKEHYLKTTDKRDRIYLTAGLFKDELSEILDSDGRLIIIVGVKKIFKVKGELSEDVGLLLKELKNASSGFIFYYDKISLSGNYMNFLNSLERSRRSPPRFDFLEKRDTQDYFQKEIERWNRKLRESRAKGSH